MKSIESTWLQVKSGSSEAWASLVRTLAPVVYSVARRWGLEESDAEDVSQQTWLALYAGRDKIEDPVALPAWLVRVANRKAQRLARNRTRDKELQPGISVESPPLPDEGLLTLERQAFLRMAVTRLDSRCRQLVEELFLTHPPKSYQQIARNLGLKPNSLGPIRARCLERLRRIFEDFGF
jgi:RNA polymerase sigma factor (sigma-70 family)